VRRCLRDPTFSCFDTIPECDRQTDRQTDRHTHTQTHDDGIYTLSIASRGKNESPSGDHANLGDILHMAKQCTIFEVFEVFRLYVPEIGYLWA